MSRPPKGPRLYLRAGIIKHGKARPDVWVIRDGTTERSTGCGAPDLAGAEAALLDYLADKHEAARKGGPALPADRRPRDPASVLVADVIAYYASDRLPELKDERRTVLGRLDRLNDWWGAKTCAEVIRSNCRAYVADRVTQPVRAFKDAKTARRVDDQTARRELNDLSAAIGHWHGEFPFTSRPEVWLPPKRESSRDALTRADAARLLKAAMGWRLQPARPGEPERWVRLPKDLVDRRRHMRRFLLMGFYTGSRHGVLRSLLWEESLAQAWVDLDKAVVFRRGRREAESRTKRRPVVKISPRLLAHMRRWRRMDQEREVELQVAREDKEFRLVSVLHFHGEPLAGRIRTAWEGCVADAGLPAEITPHWLRHSAATWMMEAAIDPWKAAGFLGMSVDVLLEHYGHHRPDYQADAATGVSGGARRA